MSTTNPYILCYILITDSKALIYKALRNTPSGMVSGSIKKSRMTSGSLVGFELVFEISLCSRTVSWRSMLLQKELRL